MKKILKKFKQEPEKKLLKVFLENFKINCKKF